MQQIVLSVAQSVLLRRWTYALFASPPTPFPVRSLTSRRRACKTNRKQAKLHLHVRGARCERSDKAVTDRCSHLQAVVAVQFVHRGSVAQTVSPQNHSIASLGRGGKTLKNVATGYLATTNTTPRTFSLTFRSCKAPWPKVQQTEVQQTEAQLPEVQRKMQACGCQR